MFVSLKLFVVAQFTAIKLKNPQFFSHEIVCPNCKHRKTVDIFCILATFMVVLSEIFLVPIFFTYKWLITFILTVRYRQKFKGIITGCDAMITFLDNKSILTINDLYFVNSDKTSDEFAEEISAHLRQKLTEEGYAKMWTSRHHFMGYLYNRTADNVCLEDVVRFYPTETDFGCEVLENCSNTELPDGNKFNFDVFIIKTGTGFCIMFRMHHTLVDGVSMYNISTNLLCQKTANKTQYAQRLQSNLWPVLQEFTTDLHCMPLREIKNALIDNAEKSDTRLYYFADKTDHFNNTMKSIGRENMVRFMSVFLAAFSESLAQFMQERGGPNLQNIYITCPRQISNDRLVDYYKNEELYSYGNDFGGFVIKIPLILENGDVFEKLRLIDHEISMAYKSADLTFMYNLINGMSHVPTRLMRILTTYNKLECSISSFPGGPKLTFFNGNTVEEKLFYVPKLKMTGISLYVYTYDDRLQFTLICGKSHIFCAEDLQKISDGILNNLNKMNAY